MSLNHSIIKVCGNNREGSYGTQADRKKQLLQVGKELKELGFKLKKIENLKPKHIERIVANWKVRGLAPATMMNRLSNMRWLCGKFGKENIIRSNQDLRIGSRINVCQIKAVQKVVDSNKGDINKITDPNVRMSLELQKQFGLRPEESMKIQPDVADRGDRIFLRGSWCKGGRPREILIRNPDQRMALEKAKAMAQGGSLIPADRSYKQHLGVFNRQTKQAGFDSNHGNRYGYAQLRYYELTGQPAPANGGPAPTSLNGQMRLADREARQIISRELGHDRIQVTAIYLGG